MIAISTPTGPLLRGSSVTAADTVTVAVAVLLAQMHIVQPGGAPAFQAHRLPDADRRQLRPPVPAEVIRRFPQVLPAGNEHLGDARQRARLLPRPDIGQRRAEDDA